MSSFRDPAPSTSSSPETSSTRPHSPPSDLLHNLAERSTPFFFSETEDGLRSRTQSYSSSHSLLSMNEGRGKTHSETNTSDPIQSTVPGHISSDRTQQAYFPVLHALVKRVLACEERIGVCDEELRTLRLAFKNHLLQCSLIQHQPLNQTYPCKHTHWLFTKRLSCCTLTHNCYTSAGNEDLPGDVLPSTPTGAPRVPHSSVDTSPSVYGRGVSTHSSSFTSLSPLDTPPNLDIGNLSFPSTTSSLGLSIDGHGQKHGHELSKHVRSLSDSSRFSSSNFTSSNRLIDQQVAANNSPLLRSAAHRLPILNEQGDRSRLARAAGLAAAGPVAAQAQWFSQQLQHYGKTSGRSIDNGGQFWASNDADADFEPELLIQRVLDLNDQQCSLYLQQRVKNSLQPDDRKRICDAVQRDVLELSMSKFGNFLVSRCLEHGGFSLTERYTQDLTGHFLTVSLDPYGCHVVQKLLDTGDEKTKDTIVNEVIGHAHTLTQKNSAHVWSKLLSTRNPPRFYERLVQTGSGVWATIAKDEAGSLIVQSILDGWMGARSSVLTSDVANDFFGVACSQWGCFVIMYLVDHKTSDFRHHAMDLATRLALDPFGAKVVDKCVKLTDLSGRVASFCETICQSQGPEQPMLIDIASHATGAQLVVTLLTAGSPPFPRSREKILKTLRRHVGTLKDTKHGQRIVALVQ